MRDLQAVAHVSLVVPVLYRSHTSHTGYYGLRENEYIDRDLSGFRNFNFSIFQFSLFPPTFFYVIYLRPSGTFLSLPRRVRVGRPTACKAIGMFAETLEPMLLVHTPTYLNSSTRTPAKVYLREAELILLIVERWTRSSIFT